MPVVRVCRLIPSFVTLLWLLGCDGDRVVGPAVSTESPGSNPACTVTVDGDMVFTLVVRKWYGGRAAAVSITLDNPWGTHALHHLATDAAIARGLRMDLEIVTASFVDPRWKPLLDTYRDVLMPQGIHFFGHGHTHALHDTLSYEDCLASFGTCFDLMQAWGLHPRAYAYPGSSGEKASTQAANRDAGFICARGSTVDARLFHIVPDEVAEPDNWYFLPAVPMGNASYRYIQSHTQLAPILEAAVEQTSWVILMYHAIGIPEGWSYYPLAEYHRDLDQIAGGDFWSANLDQAAAYLRERLALQMRVESVLHRSGAYRLTFDDALPDEVYDQPLTVDLELAPGSRIRRILVDPPVGGVGAFDVRDGTVRLDLLPTSTPRVLALE
ncbi:MAG: hypothetical protein ABIL09_20520 [Gemmatimonadota bacterium]